jgi:putative colanic acid biosynthesis glycosyltransferase
MKVLHLNIRASQGGAGRMALDLHQRLVSFGVDSRLVYGYASGIADDPAVKGNGSVRRLANKASVLGNYASHIMAGLDLFTANKAMLDESIAWSDVVHLHVPHHFFMNWNFFCKVMGAHQKPLAITAHDWWFITGRCAIVEQCTGWQRECGECGSTRFRDLPSTFDFSRFHRKRKIESMRALSGRTTVVCPSTHLSLGYRQVLTDTPISVIPNSIDLEFEMATAVPEGAKTDKKGFVFSAADLSSPVKIDRDLVAELLRLGSVEVQLIGRNNPFEGKGATCFGEVRDREKMVHILRGARALIFCSRIDNAPLTIIEALVAGCFVLAYDSSAAREILASVGGKCIPDRAAMIDVIRRNDVEALYGGINSAELAKRARSVYSGETTSRKYLEVYKSLVERGALSH